MHRILRCKYLQGDHLYDQLPRDPQAPYRKYALLIIDEWLLYPLKGTEAGNLLEIVESRYKRNSTIFCSQFDIPGWPEKLSDPLLADAICKLYPRKWTRDFDPWPRSADTHLTHRVRSAAPVL